MWAMAANPWMADDQKTQLQGPLLGSCVSISVIQDSSSRRDQRLQQCNKIALSMDMTPKFP